MVMKKIFNSLCLFTFLVVRLSGQYIAKNPVEVANLKTIPLEKTYISHSGSILFVGDYLYYSFFCLEIPSGKPSKVSTIGYVQLLDQNYKVLKVNKMNLKKGRAYGDFFIDSSFPSGNYKIIGYTQWSRNGSAEAIFEDDIFIINPFLANYEGLSLTNEEEINDSLNESYTIGNDSTLIGLTLGINKLKKRDSVTLSITNYKGYLSNGTYTLKVRQKGSFDLKLSSTPHRFLKTSKSIPRVLPKRVGDTIWLPEQRGELVYGRVTSVVNDHPVQGKTVALSFPGESFLLKYATTNSDGEFFTYIKKPYSYETVIAQILDASTNEKVELFRFKPYIPKEATFKRLYLGNRDWEYIKKRSIQSQIENQFFIKKPDSVMTPDKSDPFDGGITETILLDDYTRFTTFQETLIEVFNHAGYRKNNKYGDYIRITQDYETFNEETNSLPALVLVDGVLVNNPGAIKDYNAGLIKKISLIRDKFQFADKDYQGMMSVETFEGDFFKSYQTDASQTFTIALPFPEKKYFQQRYPVQGADQIPDYRNLLYWNPQIDLKEGGIQLEFFTSDVSGIFEIVLEGFTSYGKPIYLTKEFEVQ